MIHYLRFRVTSTDCIVMSELAEFAANEKKTDRICLGVLFRCYELC